MTQKITRLLRFLHGTATGWTPYTDRDYRVYDTATKKWKYYYFYANNWYEKS